MKKDPKEIEKKLPKSFMTPGYVREIEHGTYAMYRDVEIEDPTTGKREKFGKSIGPLFIFRLCQGDEKPDFITSDPVTGDVLSLYRIDPPHV